MTDEHRTQLCWASKPVFAFFAEQQLENSVRLCEKA